MTDLVFDFISDHLVQHVHPIVDVESIEVVFFEVLSRIKYKDKIYFPKDFLTNITDEQKYILAKIQLGKIIDFQIKYPNYSFSMNISSMEVKKGFDKLLDDIAASKDKIDTNRFIIEVTESSIIEKETVEKLRVLKSKYNYRFALDDFGTGYSSVYQIKKSNGLFELIKIDGSLVDDIESCISARDLLIDAITMAKKQKKKIVTEYISTQERFDFIKEFGSDYAQGYFFGEPNEIEDVIKELKLKGLAKLKGSV